MTHCAFCGSKEGPCGYDQYGRNHVAWSDDYSRPACVDVAACERRIRARREAVRPKRWIDRFLPEVPYWP